MNPNVTRAIASACLILMIGLLPVAVRGQDTSGVQDGGKVVALLGVSVGAEQREERMEQEVFVGSPGCGLFEEGTSRLYSLAFDVLMPVDNSGGSGPGFSLQFGLASSSAQIEAPEPYVIRATAAGESNLVELSHSYHLESNSLDVRFDLFWDQYLWRGLRLRAGAGASFALPGSTGEFNRIDHDIYRFEDGERERELPVAGPGFASIRVGPLAGLGYRIDLPSGATLDPAVIVRMNFDPDESRLSGFSIGLRLGLHFPIRRPLDPLAVSLMIGDRDHAGLPFDSVGLQLVVIDGYRSVGGAWEMGRRVEGPILAIAPRWQGAAGGGVAAWSITVRQDGDTLLAAGSDDPAPPQRIDWKIPAEDRIDTVIGLTAELHVRDSLGREAAVVKRLPLALHHLVLHTAQSRGRALHLLSVPDSALLTLRGVAPALAATILGRFGPRDTIYYATLGRTEEGDRDVAEMIAVLQPDWRKRPQIGRLTDDREDLLRLFEGVAVPERGVILVSPLNPSEGRTTPEPSAD